MRADKFVAFLFYRYYSNRSPQQAPYFSTLTALMMLASMHVMQILLLTKAITIGHFMTSWIVCGLALYLFFWKLIKEDELEDLQYPKQKIQWGNILLVLYIIADIALLALSINHFNVSEGLWREAS